MQKEWSVHVSDQIDIHIETRSVSLVNLSNTALQMTQVLCIIFKHFLDLNKEGWLLYIHWSGFICNCVTNLPHWNTVQWFCNICLTPSRVGAIKRWTLGNWYWIMVQWGTSERFPKTIWLRNGLFHNFFYQWESDPNHFNRNYTLAS